MGQALPEKLSASADRDRHPFSSIEVLFFHADGLAAARRDAGLTSGAFLQLKDDAASQAGG